MKAMMLEEKGGPFVMKDVPAPVVTEGEVLVRLRASALNHRDFYIKQGTYPRTAYPVIIGSDGAGVVEAVGANVRSSLVNSEVIINPSQNWGDNPAVQRRDFKVLGLPDKGTFAGYIAVPAGYIHPKPSSLSFEEAAAIALVGLTAFRALFTRGNLAATDKVLVTGIGGGVALAGLQFAVEAGAEVFVTSGSDEKIHRAITLGARAGVNYRSESWGEELRNLAGGFDLILDGAAGPEFKTLMDIAAPGGRIVNYGSVRGKIQDAEPARLFWKQLSILGSTMGTDEEFASMLRFVSERRIRPAIDCVLPLADLNRGMQRMEEGSQFGKIVFTNS